MPWSANGMCCICTTSGTTLTHGRLCKPSHAISCYILYRTVISHTASPLPPCLHLASCDSAHGGAIDAADDANVPTLAYPGLALRARHQPLDCTFSAPELHFDPSTRHASLAMHRFQNSFTACPSTPALCRQRVVLATKLLAKSHIAIQSSQPMQYFASLGGVDRPVY